MTRESIAAKSDSPVVQVFGLSAGISLLAAFVAWVAIPVFAVREPGWAWIPMIADVVSGLIQESGWSLIAASVALLAAALLVLTITGLTQSTSAVRLRRESTRRVISACVLAATVSATLPAWGVIAGFGRALGFRTIEPDGRLAEVDADAARGLFEDVLQLFVLGASGFILLGCLHALSKAIEQWTMDDEELVASIVANYTRAIVRSDNAARGITRQFERSKFFSYGIPVQVAATVMRLILSLIITYLLLGLVAPVLPWPNIAANETITQWEWAQNYTLLLAYPAVAMAFVASLLPAYLKWEYAPRIERGKPVKQFSVVISRVLTVCLGLLIAGSYPTLYFSLLMTNAADLAGAQWVGFFVSLFPALTVLVPGGVGGTNNLFAKIALRNHNSETRSVLHQLNKLSVRDEENDGEIFVLRTSGTFRPHRSRKQH